MIRYIEKEADGERDGWMGRYIKNEMDGEINREKDRWR